MNGTTINIATTPQRYTVFTPERTRRTVATRYSKSVYSDNLRKDIEVAVTVPPLRNSGLTSAQGKVWEELTADELVLTGTLRKAEYQDAYVAETARRANKEAVPSVKRTRAEEETDMVRVPRLLVEQLYAYAAETEPF